MLLLQTDVFVGNKWNCLKTKQCVRGVINCYKATQVLEGPTQILIWGSKIVKSPTRYIKGGPGALVSRGDLKF